MTANARSRRACLQPGLRGTAHECARYCCGLTPCLLLGYKLTRRFISFSFVAARARVCMCSCAVHSPSGAFAGAPSQQGGIAAIGHGLHVALMDAAANILVLSNPCVCGWFISCVVRCSLRGEVTCRPPQSPPKWPSDLGAQRGAREAHAVVGLQRLRIWRILRGSGCVILAWRSRSRADRGQIGPGPRAPASFPASGLAARSVT